MSQTEAYYRFEEFDVTPHDELPDNWVEDAKLEELDSRVREDGLVVALLWNKLDGVLEIHGVHEVTGAEFTFPVSADKALKALDEPIEHAMAAGLPTQGIYSTIRNAA